MLEIEPFSLYWAEVPFEDQPESKLRPVAVLENKICLISVLAITSNTSRPENYNIQYWKEAGLKKPSAVMLQYSVSLEPEMIGERIGKLHPVDILAIKERLQ